MYDNRRRIWGLTLGYNCAEAWCHWNLAENPEKTNCLSFVGQVWDSSTEPRDTIKHPLLAVTREIMHKMTGLWGWIARGKG